MQTVRHLVAGTDFSECAERALELALDLAFAAAAGLTLVHVCEQGDGTSDLDDQRLARCGQALSVLVVRHGLRGVELTGVLRSGKPWTKLDNVAAEVGASLIVIGRQGAGCKRGVELGSVADHLVRSASRPVLTVACDFDLSDTQTNTTHHLCIKNEKS